jgi:signal transduction histidine kinase
MEKVNILLVDDEPRNLDALEAILSQDDYQLLRAEDADRALRLLLEHDDVAAIILDIQMPGVNGIELAQIIKGTKRFRQIPILFLTAHMVDDSDVVTAYGAGAVDYLTKPFNPQILRHKVGVFGDLFRKTRALADLNEKLEERVKERTRELEQSEAALRLAAKQKDEFLAVLAHELRNPLAPLRTGLDILMQVQRGDSSIARTLMAMNRQLEHIVRLIDDLLDVSRINTGVLQLKKQKTDLAQIVESTTDTFRSIFDQKRVSLLVDVPHRVTSEVDPTRIAQIIGNLLHNAFKFTPEKGHVIVELMPEGGKAVIRVIDSGVGIPAEQIDRAFEMFARVERKQADAADRGAGIGLALAKRLAQMHGGDLTAFSEGEGKGTTFTLTLPADGTSVVRADRVSPPDLAPRRTAEPLDILIIEDNDDAAETLATWLEAMGHRVRVARTGPSGLELTLATRPDVVLCDVGLPDMDGVEVCQRVRAQASEFRPFMVALTGWGQDEDRKRTREAGFDLHLVKPVAPDTLDDVLSRAAPRSRA